MPYETNKKAFTLIELLVIMIPTGLILLTAGSKGFDKLRFAGSLSQAPIYVRQSRSQSDRASSDKIISVSDSHTRKRQGYNLLRT